MKRGHFIRELINAGCYLKRHGKKHDLYANPHNGKQSSVPRHSEIKETIVEEIKKTTWYLSLFLSPARVTKFLYHHTGYL